MVSYVAEGKNKYLCQMWFLKSWPVAAEMSQNKTLHLGQEVGVWKVPAWVDGLYLGAIENGNEDSKKLDRGIAIAFHNAYCKSSYLAGASKITVELLCHGPFVQWIAAEVSVKFSCWIALDSPSASPLSLLTPFFGYFCVVCILTSARCCFQAPPAPLDPQSERSIVNQGWWGCGTRKVTGGG